MTVLAVAAALMLGGLLGHVLRRGRQRDRPSHRSVDSDRVDVQAGWRNMHGG